MKEVFLDLETHLIGPGAIAPQPIVLSVRDAQKHFLTLDVEETMRAFLLEGRVLVWHNAAFDMSVLFRHYPSLRHLIWDAYKANRVRCTAIRERLKELATSGKLTRPKGFFSLAGCVERYTGVDLSAFKTGDDIWRLRYSELEGKPIEEWPAEAREYALSDTKYCEEVYNHQESWGQFGTEHLQTMSDFVLRMMTIRGILIDRDWVEEHQRECEELIWSPVEVLKNAGETVTTKLKTKTKVEFLTYAFEKKDGTLSFREKLLRKYLELNFPDLVKRSDTTNQPSLKLEALEILPDDPIVNALKEIKKYRKLLTAFYPTLLDACERGGTVHPSFAVLKETGRTSSFGDPNYPSENVQQMPRKGGVREAHVARPGYVFVAIDYCNLEMVNLAQALYDKFRQSRLRELLNENLDPHCETGRHMLGPKVGREVSYVDFVALKDAGDAQAKLFRQMAKAGNFGIPGGLSPRRMRDYLAGYGVKGVSDNEITAIYDAFFKMCPELLEFFDWFKHVAPNDDRTWTVTTNGRVRANCGYCNGLNGELLQSRSADGAKIAMTHLFEGCMNGQLEGCYLVAFIHDEFILEMPDNEDLEKHINKAMKKMIDGMKKVFPDVRVGVEASVMDRWVKDGPFRFETSMSRL